LLVIGNLLSKKISCLVFFDGDTSTNAHCFVRQKIMNIYVGNLPYDVSETDLREIFSQFGEISQINLITDKFSGQSKGFGFVEMENNSQADAAIKGLNESNFKGRNIKVNQAKPKSDRPSQSRSFLNR